jgi:hypothetical protein
MATEQVDTAVQKSTYQCSAEPLPTLRRCRWLGWAVLYTPSATSTWPFACSPANRRMN